MSIILKGIDMPKDGDRIYLLIEGDKCFNALDPIQTLAEAIQIPTPHGRLIDEKELLDKIKRGLYSEDINQVIYSVGAEDIANAPTILDEEGE